MFTNEWFSSFVQLLVLIPSAISCYLPAKNQMKFSMIKTILLCCAVIIPLAFVAASVSVVFSADINLVMLPAMIAFFFLYRLTVRFDLSRTLAVYIGVCAIQTFPAQFAIIADMYLGNNAENITMCAAFIQFGLSCFLTALFIYPARNHFSQAVDEPGMSKIWYFTSVLSSFFLVFNFIAVPESYDVIRESRLQFLFPALEICAMLVLITIYVLFYRGAMIIIERGRLEKHSQLLEMQAHQFGELQEYMRQTSRLRHDFRQSVHLLSVLAEKGDLDNIRVHLSQYEQRLVERANISYCANASLNALFAYYHELAEISRVKTDWKIELPDPLTVSELDMAALFGNLMENAIHACAALPEEERYFSLTVELCHENSLYIVSTNSFDGKGYKGSDGYRSTKHSGHGTGLISISAVAEKYNGAAQVYNSENKFFVDVIIQI